MPKLYIGNPKTQEEAFSYRVPGDGRESRPGSAVSSSGVRVQHVRPGGVIEITGDLTTAQIDSIINQHTKYGLWLIDSVAKRQVDYVSLVYSIDKPINSGWLEGVMRRNIEIQHVKGREMRKTAAIVVNNKIEADMQEQRMPGELRHLEMEIVEQRTASSDTEETVPQRVRVSRDTEGPEAAPRQKRAYTRRAA